MQKIIPSEENFFNIKDGKILKEENKISFISNNGDKVKTIEIGDNLKNDIEVFARIENLFSESGKKEIKMFFYHFSFLSMFK